MKNKKQELEAEIRNKLTMPMTVLSAFLGGKKVAKKTLKQPLKNWKRY